MAASKPDMVTQLDRQVDALDRLMAELRQGIRSQGHFDELETRARAIAWSITAAFRGDRTAKGREAGER